MVMKSVLVVNPNSSERTTAAMVAIARRYLPAVQGWTNPAAPVMITDPAALAAAGDQVAGAVLPRAQGIVVAAFGDPGARQLAQRFDGPVVGIGAAAAQAGAKGGASFAVATTTPALGASIDALMLSNADAGRYLGSFMTKGDPRALLADPAALDEALLEACASAQRAGAERVIIGGGPLAEAAIRLAAQVSVPLIQPLPEACKAIAERL